MYVDKCLHLTLESANVQQNVSRTIDFGVSTLTDALSLALSQALPLHDILLLIGYGETMVHFATCWVWLPISG